MLLDSDWSGSDYSRITATTGSTPAAATRLEKDLSLNKREGLLKCLWNVINDNHAIRESVADNQTGGQRPMSVWVWANATPLQAYRRSPCNSTSSPLPSCYSRPARASSMELTNCPPHLFGDSDDRQSCPAISCYPPVSYTSLRTAVSSHTQYSWRSALISLP